MKVLLDSHAALWVATGDERLPEAVRDLIADTRTRVVLSVATMWELTLKVGVGKLRLPDSPEVYFEGLVHEFGYDVLPVHQRHVAALAELPAIHPDPFDRMLVCQALVEDLELVSGDESLTRYPVRTIW